mmetsp:Transcript_28966/g.29311  ORF Transcript_28966/g.29311 Transcript_28966/m.29311 type:complete len:1124 (+) Transcript_28966:147-3518(+)
METVVRRNKPSSTEQSDTVHPGNLGMKDSSTTHPDSLGGTDDRMKHSTNSEPQFQYGSLLMQGLSLPIIVCFAFGGRPALIALCFGTLISYIFDLLGTLEATLVSITVTLMVIWGSLVWAARNLLQDSILNIFMILLLAIVLFFTFIAISSHFRTLRIEMDSIFFFLEPLLFANISLISSTVLTWFLCVELPVLDLPICFCTIYFVYLLIYSKPRHPSSFTPSPLKDDEKPIYILTTPVLQLLYFLPVIISPILHISLHYNVLETSWSRATGIFISIIYPSLLMIVVAENQINYWAASDRKTVSYLLSVAKLVSALCLVLALQSNPILDDLKIFSGLQEPVVSYVISGAIFLLFAAVYSHRQRVKENAVALPEVGTIHAKSQSGWIQNIVVTLCVAAASLMMSILIGLQWSTLPLTTLGAICLAELYQKEWHLMQNSSIWSQIYNSVLVIISALGAVQAGFDFSVKTLWHLDFMFYWHINLTMPDFCKLVMGLSVTAIILPCIALVSYARKEPFTGSGTDSRAAGNMVFGGAFLVASTVSAALELLVREQDWVAVGTNVDTVYPSYLLGGTSLLFLLTALHLLNIGVVRYDTVVSILLVHGCKMLPLLGMPSLTAASLAGVMMSYCLPFSLYLSYIPEETPATGTATQMPLVSFPVLYTVLFFCSAGTNSVWAVKHVFPFVLTSLLQTQPTNLQCIAAALMCFLGFSAAFVTVFWRQAAALRSMILLLASLCALVATEALGPLSFTIDRSSPTYIVLTLHPELSSDQTGMFLLLTALLVFLAVSNIFPIRKPISRIVFILLFSFCSAKALMGWAFPSLMGSHGKLLSLGYSSLPWIYCLTTTLLSTSTALHAALPQSSSTGSWMFALCGCVPLLALIWSWVQGMLINYTSGILWSVAVGHACIALSCCANELMKELLPPPPSHRQKTDKSYHHSRSISAVASVLSLIWAVLATVFSPHTVTDITVPLFSLLLLCTKRGLLMHDAHPWELVGIISTFWWVFCALCAVLVRSDPQNDWFFHSPSHGQKLGIFQDQDVSMWRETPSILPWITLLFTAVPLPVITLSFLQRENESTDLLFILTIISSMSVIGGSIWSVRLIGVIGLIYGAWRCKSLSARKVVSDRII